ncbi:MAG: hypothetical protein ACKVP3_19710 [Hyphomicrobiaceae bacterium]
MPDALQRRSAERCRKGGAAGSRGTWRSIAAGAAVSFLTAVAILPMAHVPASAQQARLTINIAPVMLAEPASRTPLPIQIAPQDAILKNSFIRIRGLPAAAALTEGHAIGPGAWAVPLVGLASLSVIVPVGLQGRWDVVIGLVTIDGTVLTESKTALVIAPTQLIAPGNKGETPSTNVASLGPSVGAPANTAERERAFGLHAKGQEQLGRGNIYSARMFFQRAAEAGLAEGALAAGGTFDPAELAKMKVIGLTPDIAAARKWYEKARELGAAEAAERLRRLEGR